MKHKTSQIKLVGVALLPLAIAACSAFKSPEQVRANAQLPEPEVSFSLPEQATNAKPVAQWWMQFNDAELDRLVSAALEHNHSVRIAAASLNESRAYLRETKLDRYPTVEAELSARRERQSADRVGTQGSRISETYSTGFDASWELDLFGRVRNGVRASQAQVAMSEADLHAAQVSVAAEVASAYVNLRGYQYLLDVAAQNVAIQQQTFNLTERYFDVGLEDELNVARAKSQLELTRARVPSIEALINTSLNRLGVLTGRQLPALKTQLAEAQALPSLPAAFAVGDPQSLLQRRPDIHRAEQALAQSVAQYNIRVADLYPSISITGGLGYLSSDWSRLGDSPTSTFLFAPQIHWAAFNLGRVNAEIDAADARTQARLAEFEQSVLVALEETDNSLQNYTREEQRRAGLQQAAKASAKAAELAGRKFELGNGDFLTVLDAQRSQLDVSAQLAQSDIQVLLNLIAVYKSLGGGWDAPTELAGR
ncbi:efflux transporter outer membrane subunit [Gilvimarinus sp. DA14]|uniref:efflux transporter outer membrane subunit n=1 Tax=Gilvimarinus sp. DA14 TaxID=2956798 RepID=UPI0020B8C610|nr:efflux transporter outer membrane subunit [Gilvimarinus sp. DA14]UTF59144.1 efflux transporter outer membrane subunit [Gilvimarinus sp. DA14]